MADSVSGCALCGWGARDSLMVCEPCHPKLLQLLRDLAKKPHQHVPMELPNGGATILQVTNLQTKKVTDRVYICAECKLLYWDGK